MKTKSKLLFITLAVMLSLLIGVFAFSASATTPTVTEDKTPSVSIDAFTLSFQDSVYIKYRVSVTNADISCADDFGMLFWDMPSSIGYNEAEAAMTAKPLGYQTEDDKVYYIFTYDSLNAKNMTDDIYAQAYFTVNGVKYYSAVEKYSILQYAYNMLGLTKDNTPTEELSRLLTDMLQYGTSAQKYFKYKTDRLANATYYQIKTLDGAYLEADLSTHGLYLENETVTLCAPEKSGELVFAGWTKNASDGSVTPVSGSCVMEVTVGTENASYAPVYAVDLTEIKNEAKSALDNYVNADDYRDAQKAELATAIVDGKSAIDTASDSDEVDAALAAAKSLIDEIETDAEITAKEPTISSPFDSGAVFTSSRATLDVYAKDANGNKLSMSKVTVTVNGEAASVNWDDTVKTSYNFVFVEGENTVVITATDGKYTKVKVYTVICDLTKPTTVTVSIEAFSVGLGYLVVPVDFELNDENISDMAEHYGYESAEAFKEKLSMAHVLDYVLYVYGLEMDYQGGLESTWNGFYMSAISGIADTTVSVPPELIEALEANGYFVDEYVCDEGTLREFDVTWGSGWMYMVNNSFPNVPFCDYVPQDGDVMRVQFTLAYGADLGDWGMMGEPLFEAVDRDPLTKMIAKAIDIGVDAEAATKVVSTFGVTQDELDAACEELEAAINAAR